MEYIDDQILLSVALKVSEMVLNQIFYFCFRSWSLWWSLSALWWPAYFTQLKLIISFIRLVTSLLCWSLTGRLSLQTRRWAPWRVLTAQHQVMEFSLTPSHPSNTSLSTMSLLDTRAMLCVDFEAGSFFCHNEVLSLFYTYFAPPIVTSPRCQFQTSLFFALQLWMRHSKQLWQLWTQACPFKAPWLLSWI
jgi:hypothetical protein